MQPASSTAPPQKIASRHQAQLVRMGTALSVPPFSIFQRRGIVHSGCTIASRFLWRKGNPRPGWPGFCEAITRIAGVELSLNPRHPERNPKMLGLSRRAHDVFLVFVVRGAGPIKPAAQTGHGRVQHDLCHAAQAGVADRAQAAGCGGNGGRGLRPDCANAIAPRLQRLGPELVAGRGPGLGRDSALRGHRVLCHRSRTPTTWAGASAAWRTTHFSMQTM